MMSTHHNDAIKKSDAYQYYQRTIHEPWLLYTKKFHQYEAFLMQLLIFELQPTYQLIEKN